MLTISGTGCALMDYLHADIRLDSEAFLRYRARRGGDGGLEPGKLVFVEDLERFAGEPFSRILEALRGGQEPDRANLGGPSIVSLIHAAQMLEGHQAQVQFFGARGVDASSDAIMHIVSRTPLEVSGYLAFAGHTPFTQVFSDPTYDHGHGERTFVNERGWRICLRRATCRKGSLMRKLSLLAEPRSCRRYTTILICCAGARIKAVLSSWSIRRTIFRAR